ncbi:phosphatidylserine decarboxylase [Elsinoe australis]|uniref:Phosphatidylserine decarboxylase n=1 Tax=Elsinoe australis TaxID=40998 RepID=A0A2P7YBX2_9PEZI|nr:phosphatidylserine decarboxylase [Elsinoe australis]
MYVREALRFFYTISFAIAVVADYPPFKNSAEYLNGTLGNYTRQHFLSQPDAIAPVGNILTQATDDVSPSKYMMWTPAGPHGPPAHPMLLDAKTLSLVWYGPRINPETLASTIQTCNDTEYITFWSGFGAGGWKQGSYYLLNNKYETVHEVTGQGNIAYADAHEFYLTPQCTGVFTAYQTYQTDLSWQNITNVSGGGWLLDSYFQEVDIVTNEIVFEWRASQHVNLSDTYWNVSIWNTGLTEDNGFDWFHINSVQKDRLGNYLVNSRHTHAIYYVCGATGNVIWTLGGKRNDFQDMNDGLAIDFRWQHHARWLDDDFSRISIYDNQATPMHSEAGRVSRGVILRLDQEQRKVWLDHEYTGTHNIKSVREGSMQVLNDGRSKNNALVGYGNEPAWTEFSENGTVIWDVVFSPLSLDRYSPDNYRALKLNWTGAPNYMPNIAPGPPPDYEFVPDRSSFDIRRIRDHASNLTNNTAYFSWNGATEVRSWVVLASNETSDLSIASHFWAEVPKVGFEDNVFLGNGSVYVTALATNCRDEVLGQTGVLDMRDFSMRDGLGRDSSGMYDTRNLTMEWQVYLAKQPKDSVFSRLRTKWHHVRVNYMHNASTPVAGGLSFVVVLGFLVLVAIPCWMYRHRRAGYGLLRTSEFEFADEFRRKKDDGGFKDEDSKRGGSESSGSFHDESDFDRRSR